MYLEPSFFVMSDTLFLLYLNVNPLWSAQLTPSNFQILSPGTHMQCLILNVIVIGEINSFLNARQIILVVDRVGQGSGSLTLLLTVDSPIFMQLNK